jgi:hypothetical protein
LDVRPQPRRKIFQVGELHADGRSLRVHLLDVSEGGAKLHCTSELSVGSAVTLHWQGQRWRGVIAWTADGKCGVRFLVPLAPAAIDALMAPL